MVYNDSTLSGAGLLVINGPLSAPVGSRGGGIHKTGGGVVILNADNTYGGRTIIQEGAVRLGASGALSGTPVIELGPQGELDASAKPLGLTLSNQTLELSGRLTGSLHAAAGSIINALHSSSRVTGGVTVAGATLNVGGVGFNETTPVAPIITAGLQLNFDAAFDPPGDAVWTNATDPANSAGFSGAASSSLVSDASVPGLSAAYHIPTSGGAAGLNNYFENAGPRSTQDATFEVWFHVDSTNAGGDQVLFEAGGVTRGVSFLLDDGQLSFYVKGIDATIASLTQSLAAGWHQAVGVIDLSPTAANDSIALYLDNTLVGSQTGLNVGDWAGGNPSGIGQFSSSLGAGGDPIAYHDRIAAVRYYNNVAFDANQVNQNYQAITDSGAVLPTTMTIDGGLTLDPDAVVRMDIADGGAADKIEIGAALAAAGGQLLVDYIGVVGLVAGDQFDLFDFASASGAFASLSLPTLPAGLMWSDRLLVDGSLLVTLAGDYNGDGVVDAADYTVWRDNSTASVTPLTGADGSGDGVVDAADYAIWREMYGAAVQVQPTQSPANAVPAPSASTLLALLCLTAPLVLGSRTRSDAPTPRWFAP